MSVNSREKGKRGERELARKLRELGYESCRRGEQYCGLNGDADVIGLPYLHIECKRMERLNLQDAIDQAKRDAREGEIPVVMHKKNNSEWLVTLRLEEFMEIFREYEAGRTLVNESEDKMITSEAGAGLTQDLSGKIFSETKPSFLTYLVSLGEEDFREFIDCLIFLKEKQEELDKAEDILRHLEDHSVKDADENILPVLEQACKGMDVKTEDDVKACLKAEKTYIRNVMYSRNLGFDPNNLYSAPEVIKERFSDYCMYIREDRDITEELDIVIDWLKENKERFQLLD